MVLMQNNQSPKFLRLFYELEKILNFRKKLDDYSPLNNKINISDEADQFVIMNQDILKEMGNPWILMERDDEAFEKFTREDFLAESYITPAKYDVIVSRLNKKKNIIFQGPPGVGKKFIANKLAFSLLGRVDDDKVELVQFHQSYSYEDFIMGNKLNNKGGYDIVNGVFFNFCIKAINNPSEKYFFIIDEINKGNISKIFGELMLLIESDKRGKRYAMSTAYSSDKFYIPENLYIIGLINTADRSIISLDYMLRHQFNIIDIEPAFGVNFAQYTAKFNNFKLNKMLEVISSINDEIQNDDSLGKGFKIGHGYFCNLNTADDSELSEIATFEIIPLLEEYWSDKRKVKIWKNKLYEALAVDNKINTRSTPKALDKCILWQNIFEEYAYSIENKMKPNKIMNEAIGEWRGIIAAIILFKYFDEEINKTNIDIKSTANRSLVKAVNDIGHDDIMSTTFDWNMVTVFSIKKNNSNGVGYIRIPFAFSSPKTLFCATSRTINLPLNFPWFRETKFNDPVTFLNASQKSKLYNWLTMIERDIEYNAKGGEDQNVSLAKVISQFINDLSVV